MFDWVGTTETLILILVAVATILPIWWIVSAYNRRVKEIEKLREDVENLKKDQRSE